MRKSYLLFVFTLIFVFTAYSQDTKEIVESGHLEDQSSDQLLAVNASQYGMKYRETQILMQNRHGVRIEYTLDRSSLELWITPQMGKSMSYVDQNWSNRDDHTHVFDRILLPGCDLSKFIRCDWDPFHSILYFEDQTLHIAQILDQPAVLVWFEKDGLVDIKHYGHPIDRTKKTFILDYSDRERDFQSAAVLGEGEGFFQQQLQLDKYRSVYTRAHMKPGQVLLIASELKKENIGEQAKEWIQTPKEEILASNEQKINESLKYGQFKFKDRPKMQELLDKSRRVTLSMHNYKGFMRSTNQYIYYLQWFRDGGMNSPHIAYTGWTNPVYHHTKFALQNPNFTNENPDDIFFGQMMGGPLTKWQEDGLFYVIWPAFTHWTQTGDKSLCEGENLQTMEKAMDWLERRAYDKEKGLFGRYFACETPMTNSRDDGWDNVTGAPTFKWGSDYEGNTIVRSYDTYINMLNYSNYLMLSAMQTDEKKAAMYYEKAMTLGKNMKKFFKYDHVLPSYGELKTIEGDFVSAKPYGMDIWDYVWGLSLPPFEISDFDRYKELREQLREDMTTTKGGYFLCTYFALLNSMDTEIHSEDSIVAAMDMLVDYSSQPGKYLPMPNAMPEMFNISEENPYHDVRPLVYSIAPWLASVTNLGIHRTPFGIAVRGSDYLESIDNYEYKGAYIDVSFEGSGETAGFKLNDILYKRTMQIPEENLKPGENKIVVIKSGKGSKNTLISSTVQLKSMTSNQNKTTYNIQAYGKNVLTFKKLDKKAAIKDASGKKVKYKKTAMDNLTYIEFEGRGNYELSLE